MPLIKNLRQLAWYYFFNGRVAVTLGPPKA